MAKKKSKVTKATKKPAKAFKLDDSMVPIREKDVLARVNTDASIAIMRLDNDQYFFTIDGIAAEFWKMIDGKASIAQICKRLNDTHQPPAARFKKDVSVFLKDLSKEKLIKLS